MTSIDSNFEGTPPQSPSPPLRREYKNQYCSYGEHTSSIAIRRKITNDIKDKIRLAGLESSAIVGDFICEKCRNSINTKYKVRTKHMQTLTPPMLLQNPITPNGR
jgi:hypothetical protein